MDERTTTERATYAAFPSEVMFSALTAETVAATERWTRWLTTCAETGVGVAPVGTDLVVGLTRETERFAMASLEIALDAVRGAQLAGVRYLAAWTGAVTGSLRAHSPQGRPQLHRMTELLERQAELAVQFTERVQAQIEGAGRTLEERVRLGGNGVAPGPSVGRPT
jgi:hypothetical protein